MYLSPEQRKLNEENAIRSDRKYQLDKLPREKVDIYAAGLVLFEMCAKFQTGMERCVSMENLSKLREKGFPNGF